MAANDKLIVDRVCDCLISALWDERRKHLGLPPSPVPAKHLKVMQPEEVISISLSCCSRRQKALAKKHGSPAEFAKACYECVPGDISMDEARAAIEKYNQEWVEAG
jgi:hypothetical protein